MKQRTLGRTGLTVSEICLGTMTFGSMADEATSLRCLDKAFDDGVDFIDIAEVYPVPPDPSYAGASENICGKWLAGKPRDSVVLRAPTRVEESSSNRPGSDTRASPTMSR